MARVAVRQFAGDIRFWEKGAGGALVPVIPEASDPDKNQPVETNSLVFSYEPGEENRVVSKRRGTHYNQPVHTDTLPGTTSVAATLLELPPLILARMLFGEGTTATVAEGSVSDAAFVATAVGIPLQLPHRMLKATPTPVVEKTGTPLVLGTDYTLDLRRGQLLPLTAGAIDAADALTLTYSYEAHVKTTIAGGAVPTKSFYITGDVQDRISEENGELTIPEARLTVDGDVDWLSSTPIQAVLSGPCIVADGEDAPYTFELYGAAE